MIISTTSPVTRLCGRFKEQATIHDLDEAIDLCHVALQLCPSGHINRSLSLRYPAVCLSRGDETLEVVAELEEFVTFARATLELRIPGHPRHDEMLYHLARYLFNRFKEQGTTDGLDEAIELYRAASQLHPRGHPALAKIVAKLATVLKQGILSRKRLPTLTRLRRLDRCC